jgi:hypothetical protein
MNQEVCFDLKLSILRSVNFLPVLWKGSTQHDIGIGYCTPIHNPQVLIVSVAVVKPEAGS